MTQMVNQYWANQEQKRHNLEMERLEALNTGAKVKEAESSSALKKQQTKESAAKEYETYVATIPERWSKMLHNQADAVGSMFGTAKGIASLFA